MYCFLAPGLGKTTLSQIVARELGSWFRATSGPCNCKGRRSCCHSYKSSNFRDVLFIDEIHRLNPAVEGNTLSSNGRF